MSSIILQIPGIPGGPEVLLLLLLAVLLFGANKIPKLARSSGQAIGEFQKGREQVEQELQDMKDGEGEEAAEGTAPNADREASTTEPPAETDTTAKDTTSETNN
jgi:sec-independent protein translocase protein TatA